MFDNYIDKRYSRAKYKQYLFDEYNVVSLVLYS